MYEWTTYNDANGKASPGDAWMELKDVIDGSSQLKSEFVPQVIIDEGWDSLVNGIGQYNAGLNGSGGALMRGGYWGGLVQVFSQRTWAPFTMGIMLVSDAFVPEFKVIT